MDNNLKQTLTKFRQSFEDKVDNKLEDYAKVDGNYPTLTAGLADNLTPYSEDSGAEQTNPFISNGTGTNNNTEIVTVGDYGLLKEKQGNSLAVNQLNNNNQNSSNLGGITYTKNSDGSWTLTGTATTGANKIIGYIQQESVLVGHKYLVFGSPSGSQQNAYACYIDYWGFCDNTIITSSVSRVLPVKLAVADGYAISGSVTFNIKIVDLTQMFNGNIPQDLLDNPSHFSWYYNGDLSYNTGSLVNANGVKLVSTGRNIWDEETELGYWNAFNGNPHSSTTEIRCKNFFQVIGNTKYYIANAKSGMSILYFDKDKNYLDYKAINATNNIFTTPSNCRWIKFNLGGQYGTTYNHDITISLYYTPAQGGEGYDKYYPYEQPYVVDTGNEVLRKAGSVCDYKEPNGLITRRVARVKLKDLDFDNSTPADSIFRCWNLNTTYSLGIKFPSSNSEKANAISNEYQVLDYSAISTTYNKVFSLDSGQNGRLVIIDKSFTDLQQFKNHFTDDDYIYFELATPTTEQGTPFAENLPINDYGMLYWLDENDNLVGIPQGAKIFYPTNYKGFVDDMYSRVDGDSGRYVIDSELEPFTDKDTQLFNALGGTLRQVLATSQNVDFLNTDFIDLGTLSWENYLGTTGVFRATVSGIKGSSTATNNGKIICSKYKTDNIQNVSSSLVNNAIAINNDGTRLYVIDTSFGTNATTFKNAMKGVLLAYEKA